MDQLELFETRFNHNDLEYEMWYERQAELCEDDNGNPINFDCDTVYARTEFAKHYVAWINSELGTDIKFLSVFFPKEYNFMTDAININYSMNDIEKLRNWTKSNHEHVQALIEKIKGYSTSCSGYIALHSENDFYNQHGLLMAVMLEVFAEVQDAEFSQYFDIQCIYDHLYKEAK